MHEKNLRRLVVVDERGRIAGIVTKSDLLQVFLRDDEELRIEIAGTLVPALLPSSPGVGIDVDTNVVTLSGHLDRKSDADILTRLTSEVDGVVDVVDNLTYRWDDSAPAPVAPISRRRDFRAI
jgi:CBS domain-containing protein